MKPGGVQDRGKKDRDCGDQTESDGEGCEDFAHGEEFREEFREEFPEDSSFIGWVALAAPSATANQPSHQEGNTDQGQQCSCGKNAGVVASDLAQQVDRDLSCG